MDSEERFSAVMGTTRGTSAAATPSTTGEASQEINATPSDVLATARQALDDQANSDQRPLLPSAAHLFALARYAAIAALFAAVGVAAAGLVLIVEGITRRNNTYVVLGVVCLLVTLLASGAGAWRIAGAGIEVERQAITRIVESPHISFPVGDGTAGADSQISQQELQPSPERPPP